MNEHELAQRLDVALQTTQVAPGDLAAVRRRARQRTMRRRAAQWTGGVALVAVVGLGVTALFTPAGLPIIGDEPSVAPTDTTPSAAETAPTGEASSWWCPTTTFDIFGSDALAGFFFPTGDGPPTLAAAYIDTVGNLRTWQQRPIETDDPNLPPASGGSQDLLDGVDDQQAVFVCVFHGTFMGPGGGGDPAYTLATVTAFPDGTAAPYTLVPASKADEFEAAPPTAEPLRQPMGPPLLECDAGVTGTADQAASQAIQDWLVANRDAETPDVFSARLREDLGRVELGVEPDITDSELDAVAQAFDPRTICITPGEAPRDFNSTAGDGS